MVWRDGKQQWQESEYWRGDLVKEAIIWFLRAEAYLIDRRYSAVCPLPKKLPYDLAAFYPRGRHSTYEDVTKHAEKPCFLSNT